MAQGLHVLRVENIALLAHGHRHPYRVTGALEVAGVFQVIKRKGMMRGNGFQVACIEPYLTGHQRQHHRDDQADTHDHETVVEQRTLQAVA
ncbi:hypothetical protein D3C76_1307180 [compost metagenome]